ncbi:50S ribosomal protein L19 [Candidatus Beckwithbacteria bacterium]|nr:50S ribosomal protein L19 [Candidatus Beckwithbacteria bacterium]
MALYLKHNDTQLQVGDTVKVHQKIVEGEKTRTQIFEGLVIKTKGHDGEKTFTVRKISSGIGVEKIWPVDSPFVEKIEVVGTGTVRRAKLYYLRNRTGRLALKVKVRRDTKEGNVKAKISKPAKKAAGQTGGKPSQKTSSK